MVEVMDKWRYSLRWSLQHRVCPGAEELAVVIVPAGTPVPESIMCQFVAGSGYAVCLDFLSVRPVRRWTPERKAQARQRNLIRRVMKAAPLFADELITRELAARPDYFKGK